jgi:peptide/nickel transport system substrate-binding protein
MLKRRDLFPAAAAVAASLAGRPPTARAAARKLLIIASDQDLPDWDPHEATGYSASMLLRNTYDALVRVEGVPPKVIPNLAASWTESPDGMQYSFKLVPNATFRDGSRVDAAAVQYSFNRLLRLNRGPAWMVAGILDQTSVTAPDPETVQIQLRKPFAAFLQVLPWIWIVDPKQVEANKGTDDGRTWLQSHTAGSGPFIISRNEPGNLYQFDRVPSYWRKGGGNLTGGIWKIVRETSTQRLALSRGEVHVAVDLTSEDMDFLKGKPGVKLLMEPEFRTFNVDMNTRHGPLTDINLRKAVSYAFNYQGMLAAAGYAQLMIGPLPDSIPGFDKALVPYRTDLAKAKEYLAKSNTPNGGLKLTYTYVSGLENERRIGLVLLDSLKQLNIDLDIKPAVWPDMVAATKSPETFPDFMPIYNTANYADADNVAFAGYHSSLNGNFQNPVYSDPQTDSLIAQARAETDPAKRAAIYVDFQKRVMDQAPDIFGVLELRKLAFRTNVENFVFTPIASNAIELFSLSLA